MPLDKENFAQKVKSVYDYRCTVSAGERYFVLGVGVGHNRNSISFLSVSRIMFLSIVPALTDINPN